MQPLKGESPQTTANQDFFSPSIKVFNIPSPAQKGKNKVIAVEKTFDHNW